MKPNLPKILFVDDEPGFTRLLKLTLDKTGKYEVTTANSPREGLAILETQSFDMLFSDIVMPEMDGGDFCALARERHPTLPVVFLTAIVSSIENPEGLIGGHRFLAKPVSLQQLINVIDSTLAGRSGLAEPAPADPVSPAEGNASTPRDLFPYIIGGLLHDAKNTMFAAREKLRRLAAMCDKTSDDRLSEAARFVTEQVGSLDCVMDVIHQISRAYYADESHLVPEINERVSALVREFQERFPGVRVEAEIEAGFDESPLPAGVSLFVVRELLQNAARACANHPDGSVRIGARIESESTAVFDCTNSHGSFPAAKLDQIQRQAVRPEKGEMAGGRGLYFISEIARRLGGFLKAQNSDPAGAIIEIRLQLPKTRP